MSGVYDTLVIGAGAAGLQAGVDLARAGQRVMIVEARDRIGGRILTRHLDAPLELGAEFVHGLPEATWTVLRESALRTTQRGGAPYRYDGAAICAADEEPASAFDTLAQMSGWLMQQPAGTDMSFDQFLTVAGISGVNAERAGRYVEGFNAADETRISVVALARQQAAEEATDADRLYHLNAGYDALPNYLAGAFERAGGELRLAHRVLAIDWRREAVAVHLADARGSLSARRVIITLPLGVLKSGAVRFRPEVPGLNGMLSGLEMGPVLRIALLFRRNFWSEVASQMLFLFSPDQPIPTWWTAHPSAAPLLTGWIGGAAAVRHIGPTRGEALIEVALRQLSAMFRLSKERLRNDLLAGECHDWMADPLAGGAYSYACVGGADASAAMARMIDNTLLFAGEHTDTEGHWGTVHAALASGHRAAGDLLSSA